MLLLRCRLIDPLFSGIAAWVLFILVASFSNFHTEAIPPQVNSDSIRSEIGRRLFYDKKLSMNGLRSCASCHDQHLAFSDGYRTSLGATGEPLRRNAPPLFNLHRLKVFTWANAELTSIRPQMLIPLFSSHPVEMGFLQDSTYISEFLQSDPYYREWFPLAFPESRKPYSLSHMLACLESFLMSIRSYQSPYDAYLQGHTPLTPRQQRGMHLFFSSELGCSGCHAGSEFTLAASTQEAFFNNGLLPPAGIEADSGLYEITRKPSDLFRFRVPTLRNLAFTAPYMHNGSLATLSDVIRHYEQAGIYRHAYTDPRIKKFSLSDEDHKALIAFLLSLSDSSLIHNPRWSEPVP